MEDKNTITISIRSNKVRTGKTTLAVELAVYIADILNSEVLIVSDDNEESLIDKFESIRTFDNVEVIIEDLNGYSKESFNTAGLNSTEIKVHPSYTVEDEDE